MTYNELDEILYRLDHSLDLSDNLPHILEKVQNMIKKSEHKRKLPPIFPINGE